MKNLVYICIIALCVVFSLSALATAHLTPATITPKSGAPINIEVEFALTQLQKATGLMHRDSMPQNYGMIFLFNQKRPIYMWMKNTKIPLDMIFFDETGAITNIIENTTPFSEKILPSHHPVTGIIELNAGFTQTHNIKIGDKIDWEK